MATSVTRPQVRSGEAGKAGGGQSWPEGSGQQRAGGNEVGREAYKEGLNRAVDESRAAA